MKKIINAILCLIILIESIIVPFPIKNYFAAALPLPTAAPTTEPTAAPTAVPTATPDRCCDVNWEGTYKEGEDEVVIGDLDDDAVCECPLAKNIYEKNKIVLSGIEYILVSGPSEVPPCGSSASEFENFLQSQKVILEALLDNLKNRIKEFKDLLAKIKEMMLSRCCGKIKEVTQLIRQLLDLRATINDLLRRIAEIITSMSLALKRYLCVDRLAAERWINIIKDLVRRAGGTVGEGARLIIKIPFFIFIMLSPPPCEMHNKPWPCPKCRENDYCIIA